VFRSSKVHPAFATIEFGPFETSYHREVVDERFREALSSYLERELLPQVSEPYETTKGILKAAFNDEKYCGPNSAVRDRYKLEFQFLRGGESDDIKLEIYRDPKPGTFRPRHVHSPIVLWTKEKKDAQRAFRESINSIVARIDKGEKSQWMCPRCSAVLRLVDEDYLFNLDCPNKCFVVNWHRDPKTREFMHGHVYLSP
jgi:hypothetical protein